MHQSIIRACLLGTIAIAGVAHAAAPDPKSFQINLSATVPPDAGFEIKEGGVWKLSEPQALRWSAEQKKLSTLVLPVNVKSGVGRVQVKLGNADEPRLVHETDSQAYFAVGVNVNGRSIGADPVDIVTKDDAKSGKSVVLNIVPGAASDKIKDAALAGKYSGQLPLVFETVIE